MYTLARVFLIPPSLSFCIIIMCLDHFLLNLNDVIIWLDVKIWLVSLSVECKLYCN